jgi:bacterioferritin
LVSGGASGQGEAFRPSPAQNRENHGSYRSLPQTETAASRKAPIASLNEDLAREYQGIISSVIYLQVLKNAAYMNFAAELENHAQEEVSHALMIAKQNDYLGECRRSNRSKSALRKNAEEILRFDLENETETIRNYRQRLRQFESLGEFALAERVCEILMQEQEHHN